MVVRRGIQVRAARERRSFEGRGLCHRGVVIEVIDRLAAMGESKRTLGGGWKCKKKKYVNDVAGSGRQRGEQRFREGKISKEWTFQMNRN